MKKRWPLLITIAALAVFLLYRVAEAVTQGVAADRAYVEDASFRAARDAGNWLAAGEGVDASAFRASRIGAHVQEKVDAGALPETDVQRSTGNVVGMLGQAFSGSPNTGSFIQFNGANWVHVSNPAQDPANIAIAWPQLDAGTIRGNDPLSQWIQEKVDAGGGGGGSAFPGKPFYEPPAVGSLTLTNHGSSTLTKANSVLSARWAGPASGFAIRTSGQALTGFNGRVELGFSQVAFPGTGLCTGVYLKNTDNAYAVYALCITGGNYVFQRTTWTDTVTRATNVDVSIQLGYFFFDPALFRMAIYVSGDDAICEWSIDGGQNWVASGLAASTFAGFFDLGFSVLPSEAGFTAVLYENVAFSSTVVSLNIIDAP